MKCQTCGTEIPDMAYCDQCGKKQGHSAKETVVSAGPSSAKYQMIREIGRGGMGIVFEALNKEIGKHIAIKKMREEIAVNQREKKRFMDEARRVAELHHPNIVDIYDIYEDGSSICLVFEYVDGETLDQVINRESKISAGRAVKAGVEVCKALEHAHAKRLIHRDIKPANIMLSKDGFVKVMDFGIARQASDTLSRLTGTESSGTLAYMAPEQHLGKSDERTDIYSLGITLYEMVTGELPFNGPDYLAQKREMLYKKPFEFVKDLPAGLEDAIMSCLQCDADKRPHNATVLREALEGIK